MIRHDCNRAFGNRFWAAVGISVFCILIMILELNVKNECILYQMDMLLYSCEYMLVIAISTLPYACVFIEEFERKTIYQVITRTNLKQYILSKTFMILISSVFVVMSAMMMFVLALRISGHEWISDYMLQCYEMNGTGFVSLELWWMIERGYEWLFFLIAGLQMGLLAAIVSLIAAFLSLYIKNRMMITICPVICLYIMYKYLSGAIGYGYGIYAMYNIFQNYTFTGQYFTVHAFITTIIVYIIMTMLIYHRVKRMIQND